MLYNLLLPFSDHLHILNLIRYLTFRSGAACLTSLVISFMLGPRVIRMLRNLQKYGQPIRLDGPERHLVEKKGTPTMGGVLILTAPSRYRRCYGPTSPILMSGPRWS